MVANISAVTAEWVCRFTPMLWRQGELAGKVTAEDHARERRVKVVGVDTSDFKWRVKQSASEEDESGGKVRAIKWDEISFRDIRCHRAGELVGWGGWGGGLSSDSSIHMNVLTKVFHPCVPTVPCVCGGFWPLDLRRTSIRRHVQSNKRQFDVHLLQRRTKVEASRKWIPPKWAESLTQPQLTFPRWT